MISELFTESYLIMCYFMCENKKVKKPGQMTKACEALELCQFQPKTPLPVTKPCFRKRQCYSIAEHQIWHYFGCTQINSQTLSNMLWEISMHVFSCSLCYLRIEKYRRLKVRGLISLRQMLIPIDTATSSTRFYAVHTPPTFLTMWKYAWKMCYFKYQ